MTSDTLDFGTELAAYTAGALLKAVENGELTPEQLDRAKGAMRAGAVIARRGPDGTFLIQIGSVAAVEGHIFDLPSLAADWEADMN
ncbi:hypothetical protein [Streptomyces sp. B1-3]|uniref:hypothetical protein n=1 Tax=Streptomyces sp. B1-3 TaxID=3141453 RepID=UPI003D2C5967